MIYVRLLYIIYFRLHANTRYNFRVAATNDIGKSNFSDPSDEVRTRQDSKFNH